MQAGGGRLSLSTDGDKCAMVIYFFLGGGGELTNSYLSMYLVYIVFLSFSQKFFSLATLARLRFTLHLEMRACNVLYQPYLYCSFLGVIISDCQLPKFTENTYKIAQNCVLYKMPNNCLRGWGWRKKGGDVRMGEERHGRWKIDAPGHNVDHN